MEMVSKWIDRWSEEAEAERAEEREPRPIHGSKSAEQDKAPTYSVPPREVGTVEEENG